MSKRKVKGEIGSALAVNAGAFALGGVGGFILAMWLCGSGLLSFSNWVRGYTAVIEAGGGTVSFWPVLWNAARWPLLVWLLGCTALGTWMIPLAFALRGFCLCFSVAGLSGGTEGGIFLAFLLFGLGGTVTLPVFFLFGTQSWGQAMAVRGQIFVQWKNYGRAYWVASALGWLGVFGCALGEYCMMPTLLIRLIPLMAGA